MVTNETALRLKAANFPQPAPVVGQFWYENRNWEQRIFFVSEVQPIGFGAAECVLTFLISGAATVVRSNSPFWGTHAVYCPTASEILLLLPSEYRIESVSEGGVAVFRHTWDDTAPAESTHESMDEALALAWLKINEQK